MFCCVPENVHASIAKTDLRFGMWCFLMLTGGSDIAPPDSEQMTQIKRLKPRRCVLNSKQKNFVALLSRMANLGILGCRNFSSAIVKQKGRWNDTRMLGNGLLFGFSANEYIHHVNSRTSALLNIWIGELISKSAQEKQFEETRLFMN